MQGAYSKDHANLLVQLLCQVKAWGNLVEPDREEFKDAWQGMCMGHNIPGPPPVGECHQLGFQGYIIESDIQEGKIITLPYVVIFRK